MLQLSVGQPFPILQAPTTQRDQLVFVPFAIPADFQMAPEPSHDSLAEQVARKDNLRPVKRPLPALPIAPTKRSVANLPAPLSAAISTPPSPPLSSLSGRDFEDCKVERESSWSSARLLCRLGHL
jgi:hypothetical protein